MNHNRDKIAIASLFIVGVVMVSAVAIYDDNQDLDAYLHFSGQLGGVDWEYNNGTIDVFPSKNPAPGYEMGVMADSDTFFWGLEYDSKYPGRAELIRVYVKEGVTSLSSDSFSWTGCNNHNSEGMGLIDVSLPNTLTTIGDRTFQYSIIEDLTIPMNVTEIGNEAFFANKLKSVTVMPKIPPKIGTDVFTGNYYITQINVPASSLEAYKAAPGWSNYADKMVPVEFEYPTSGTIMNIDWKIQDGSLTLSKNPNDEDGRILFTKNIWKSAGVYDIEKVVIGDGITNVPAGMFRGSNIESVVIGESVETIEMNAFRECEKLYDVVVGGAVKSIGPAAFRDCTSLEAIVLGESVEMVYSMAFQGVPLKSLYMPQGIAIVDTLFSKSFDIREWYDTDGRWLIGNQIGGHLFKVDGSVAKAVTAGESEIPAQDVFKSPLKTIRLYLNALAEDLKFIWEERFAPQMKLIRL